MHLAVPSRPTRKPTRSEASHDVPAAVLLALTGLIYNDWLLAFVLPTGLDARHSYVSELYATDQPFHALFAIIEVIAAVSVTSGALLALRRASGRWSSAGWWSLIAFGAFSVADVLFPMRCAASVERSCEVVNTMHTTTSALVHTAIFASMFLLTVAARHEADPAPAIRRWGPVILPCALVSAVATVGPLFGCPGWHGVAQRVHLLLVGAWLLVVAQALRTRHRREPRTG
ncbi:Protein of unknown function [Streptomyces sp. 2323.1]|uniref:DUF998 domain-containing protein n=1 Tax=Streptomyces sp. 2323.1 TaxID=1938841 RepID=UPI000BBF5EEE|nr:DUF998 domain-containing protein [Streptomyces sp. 2323.1]SOE16107.1 Protein of unknown function [Streptomyces sp. 2323.1]